MQPLSTDVLGISKTPWVFGQLVNSWRFFQNRKIYFLKFMAIWENTSLDLTTLMAGFGAALTTIFLVYNSLWIVNQFDTFGVC